MIARTRLAAASQNASLPFLRVNVSQRKQLLAFFVTPLLLANAAPDPAHLRATIDKLVSFGTRHTMSTTTDPKRGIGAARNWVASEFRKLGLTVERPSRTFSGPRAPNGVVIEDVLGILPGERSDEVLIVAGHIDSRVTDVMDATSDAPGANDDGSGVALVMEAARLMAKEKHRATIVFAALSGEEQGLWGGTLLAETAKAKGWKVAAMLNNDIVGNSVGTDGRRENRYVRVFSEGIGLAQDLATLRGVRQIGGEDDSPSRALAKRIGQVAHGPQGRQPDGEIVVRADGFGALLVRRSDRFGRGGDHTPMLEAGYPAVRFTSAVENYDAQHQNLRSENGRVYGDTADRMDFPYLAQITALNVQTLRGLADAPLAPAKLVLDGAVRSDTTATWTAVDGATGYRLRWRRADKQDWIDSKDIPAKTTSVVLPVIVDDTFIGVSALGKNGAESLVTFGGLK
jgi:Zn-dependent M28 family amino/carboxypeptidase